MSVALFTVKLARHIKSKVNPYPLCLHEHKKMAVTAFPEASRMLMFDQTRFSPPGKRQSERERKSQKAKLSRFYLFIFLSNTKHPHFDCKPQK